MAKIVRTVKHVRGPFGQIIKWVFIIFNVVMAIWLFGYWVEVAPLLHTGSEAHQTGASIGVTMGTGLIVMIWGLGDIILGLPLLLTRGKRIEFEESVV